MGASVVSFRRKPQAATAMLRTEGATEIVKFRGCFPESSSVTKICADMVVKKNVLTVLAIIAIVIAWMLAVTSV